jgi:hypothetical protein
VPTAWGPLIVGSNCARRAHSIDALMRRKDR